MRCERCLELQIDDMDDMAEVQDEKGELLIIHVTCMLTTDRVA